MSDVEIVDVLASEQDVGIEVLLEQELTNSVVTPGPSKSEPPSLPPTSSIAVTTGNRKRQQTSKYSPREAYEESMDLRRQ